MSFQWFLRGFEECFGGLEGVLSSFRDVPRRFMDVSVFFFRGVPEVSGLFHGLSRILLGVSGENQGI